MLLSLTLASLMSAAQQLDLQEASTLLNAESPVDRERASRAFKRIGTPALSRLKELSAASDPELAARARSLIDFIEISATLTPKLRQAIPGVEERLATHGEWLTVFLEATRPDSVNDLKLGDADLGPLVAPIMKELKRPEHAEVFCQRVGALKVISALPQVRELLNHSNEMVVAAAITSAGNAGMKLLAGEIRPLLQSESVLVRGSAIEALGKLGDRDSVPALMRFMRADGDLCSKAMVSLADLGAMEAVPAMARELFYASGSSRIAAQSLIKMQARDVVPDILQSLTKCDQGKAGPAIDVVVALASSEQLKSTSALLNNPSDDARAIGALVLGLGRQVEMTGKIESLLSDSSLKVRLSALKALRHLGATSASKAVATLLGNEDESLGRAAKEWILDLEAVESAAPVATLLSSPLPERGRAC